MSGWPTNEEWDELSPREQVRRAADLLVRAEATCVSPGPSLKVRQAMSVLLEAIENWKFEASK